MSKIGRKPIDISGLTVEVKGQAVNFKGSHANGSYQLPNEIAAKVDGNSLQLIASDLNDGSLKTRELNRVWGLHRALLCNALTGAKKEFEKNIEIVGLGFKAAQAGNKLVFNIGFSHKIDYELPKGVSIAIDKTGQKITVKSADKELAGHVCSQIKALRSPEPYKGTGIRLGTDKIKLKPGKAKGA